MANEIEEVFSKLLRNLPLNDSESQKNNINNIRGGRNGYIFRE